MNPQPKIKPVRDPKFLAFIRSQPCLICGGKDQVHAHHTETGGIGTKGSDHSAVPLCWNHHREVHDKYGKRGPWSEAELIEIRRVYLAKAKQLR